MVQIVVQNTTKGFYHINIDLKVNIDKPPTRGVAAPYVLFASRDLLSVFTRLSIYQ